MKQNINCIIRKINRNKILVVGDIILDCSVDGEISGLSAEAPIMTFREHQTSYALGGAANVALNLTHANQNVVLVSVLGDDNCSSIVKTLLQAEGVSTNGLVIDSTRKTTIKKRFYTKQKEQIFRSDSEDRFVINNEIERLIVDKITECIEDVDAIVLSDYLKGCLTYSLINTIVSIGHKRSIKIIVDPKDADFSKYANCDVIKPNRKELAMMINKSSLNYEDIADGCKRICEGNHHDLVVVTLGEEGMFAYESSGKTLKLDATKTTIVDVSGAGDTAVAYLATGIASGMSFEESLILANLASGKKVAKSGAVPVGYVELISFPKRIENEQIQILKQALMNKKVVFTNGCFDLLHAGHIHSLTQARNFGDVLVVGINSDESVKRLKGDARPVIPLEERIQMLEALSCVDFIIPFDDDTPLEIIKSLLPSVLVKGADYRNKTVVGSECVIENGGEVKYIEMYDGFSTSDIVKKIKES